MTIFNNQEFINECEALCKNCVNDNYIKYRSIFLSAGQMTNDTCIRERSLFLLLAHACELRLNPDRLKDPFGRLVTWHDGTRSFDIMDFTDEDLCSIEGLVSNMANHKLVARLYDILWIRRKEYKFAVKAIGAYFKVPLSFTTWISNDAGICWKRGIRLALQLQNGDKNYDLKKIFSLIFDKFNSVEQNEIGFCLDLAGVLQLFKLDNNTKEQIVRRLQNIMEMNKG